MGAYLNKPITEKETEQGGNEKIRYGATTMQGWRINQEDAHNCIVNFHDGWHIFAVYDGHGGSEVAKYTAEHFPEFLRKKEFWNAEDLSKVLSDAFVDFDDVLRSDPVMKQLKKLSKKNQKYSANNPFEILANHGKDGEEEEDESDENDEESNLRMFEESHAPLDQLLAKKPSRPACQTLEQLLSKYGYALMRNGGKQAFQHIAEIATEQLAEKESSKEGENKKDETTDEDGEASGADKKGKRPNESPPLERAKRAKSDADVAEEKSKEDGDAKKNGEEAETAEKTEKSEESENKEESAEASSSDANGDKFANFPGKQSKGIPVKEKVAPVTLPGADEDSSEDEDYVGEEEEEDEEEDESEEEEVEMVEMEEESYSSLAVGPAGETPGDDSGTTACVCIVAPGKVIVANAGDSRAVLCRAGKAVDLSIDHKPEDDIEKTRIVNAGGSVNEDGRVNGGLNLSRALGDHCYKKNKALQLKDQMISALPDVKVEEISEDDEFIVVACDGIWNSLDSQQVVDFVKTRLDAGKAPPVICEELCTECLADSTAGDGTGCDNMTVIIAHLKPGPQPAQDGTAAAAAPEPAQV